MSTEVQTFDKLNRDELELMLASLSIRDKLYVYLTIKNKCQKKWTKDIIDKELETLLELINKVAKKDPEDDGHYIVCRNYKYYIPTLNDCQYDECFSSTTLSSSPMPPASPKTNITELNVCKSLAQMIETVTAMIEDLNKPEQNLTQNEKKLFDQYEKDYKAILALLEGFKTKLVGEEKSGGTLPTDSPVANATGSPVANATGSPVPGPSTPSPQPHFPPTGSRTPAQLLPNPIHEIQIPGEFKSLSVMAPTNRPARGTNVHRSIGVIKKEKGKQIAKGSVDNMKFKFFNKDQIDIDKLKQNWSVICRFTINKPYLYDPKPGDSSTYDTAEYIGLLTGNYTDENQQVKEDVILGIVTMYEKTEDTISLITIEKQPSPSSPALPSPGTPNPAPKARQCSARGRPLRRRQLGGVKVPVYPASTEIKGCGNKDTNHLYIDTICSYFQQFGGTLIKSIENGFIPYLNQNRNGKAQIKGIMLRGLKNVYMYYPRLGFLRQYYDAVFPLCYVNPNARTITNFISDCTTSPSLPVYTFEEFKEKFNTWKQDKTTEDICYFNKNAKPLEIFDGDDNDNGYLYIKYINPPSAQVGKVRQQQTTPKLQPQSMQENNAMYTNAESESNCGSVYSMEEDELELERENSINSINSFISLADVIPDSPTSVCNIRYPEPTCTPKTISDDIQNKYKLVQTDAKISLLLFDGTKFETYAGLITGVEPQIKYHNGYFKQVSLKCPTPESCGILQPCTIRLYSDMYFEGDGVSLQKTFINARTQNSKLYNVANQQRKQGKIFWKIN